MPTTISDILDELDATERGLVLGLLAAGGDGQASVAGTVAAPAGDRCAAALLAIAARPRTERVQLMGALAREALAPLPAGVENVHADTLRKLLEFESSETIRLIVVGAPPALRTAAVAALVARDAEDHDLITTPPLTVSATVEMQRAVLSSIVAVPRRSTDARPKRLGLRLLALPPDAILVELRATGADLLGTSLAGSDEATINRAAAHVGVPWSQRIGDAARATVDPVTDSVANGRAWARTLVGGVIPGKDPLDTLDRLGACAIGDRLSREDPDLAIAVAQRLSADLAHQLLLSSEPRPKDRSA